MEKIIKFLPVMAILLASGLAVATTSKTEETKESQETAFWVRKGTAMNPNADNTWVLSSPSASCEAAEKLCQGEFLIGYNPNANSNSANVINNQSTIHTSFGYAP